MRTELPDAATSYPRLRWAWDGISGRVFTQHKNEHSWKENAPSSETSAGVCEKRDYLVRIHVLLFADVRSHGSNRSHWADERIAEEEPAITAQITRHRLFGASVGQYLHTVSAAPCVN